jgi:hypothetical protein
VRPSTKVTMAVLALGLTAWVAIPLAVGQDKPAEAGALDPKLKPLIGTWEGRVQFQSSRDEQSRILVIQERAGQLEGRYGIPGKGLERVVLSVEADTSRPKISFKTSAGHTVSLELVKEDWLSGTMVLTGGGRGGGSPNRPLELERKK